VNHYKTLINLIRFNLKY